MALCFTSCTESHAKSGACAVNCRAVWTDGFDKMIRMRKTEGNAMRISMSRSSGKADPFGLLVLAVMLALTVTIGIQAQASSPEVSCDQPCVTGDLRH